MTCFEEMAAAELARRDRRFRDAALHYANAAELAERGDPALAFGLLLEAGTMQELGAELEAHETIGRI